MQFYLLDVANIWSSKERGFYPSLLDPERAQGGSLFGPRIWEKLQSPCPNIYWAWFIVVQGINDGDSDIPSFPCTFRKTGIN